MRDRTKRNTRVFVPIRPLSRHARGFKTRFPKWRDKLRRELRTYRRGGRLWLKVKFYFRGPCYVDIDNYLVPLFNALEDKWFVDDKQLKKLEVEIIEYHHKYGIFMEIGRLL